MKKHRAQISTCQMGKGKNQMYTTEKTPEDNPGALVKLPNLEKKYGTSMYLMDRKSGQTSVYHWHRRI